MIVTFESSEITTSGTEANPVELTQEEYDEVRAWLCEQEQKLAQLDGKEWDQAISGMRATAAARYGWWFPGVKVRVTSW